MEIFSIIISAAISLGAFAGMTRARLKSIDTTLARIEKHLENQNAIIQIHSVEIALLRQTQRTKKEDV